MAGCSALERVSRQSDDGSDELIDDWQYDPPREQRAEYSGGSQASADDSIGLAAGGAADIATFRRNVTEGYLPIPESMAYEGLFHDYYFDTGGDGSCSSLFCPTYTPAITSDPLSSETERFLSVGLDSGLAQSDFERPPLNLVVVLDVSGSMGSSFDEYYYDQFGNERRVSGETDRRKIAVARDVLADLTEQLRPDDRFGVVLFESRSYIAKPLRRVADTDMDAIREHIQTELVARGGTNISAGMDDAAQLLEDVVDADDEDYEHRSILLTDAQVNTGDTNEDELQSSLQARAERGMHTSFVGIGVDFNADLIDQITSVRGANYYGVRSADQFERRLVEEFEYMVTPLVYDLSLELDAAGYDITQVYGSPTAAEATGELMRVNTLFPSPSNGGKAKGGIVLVQVERTEGAADAATLELKTTWEERSGETGSAVETVEFLDSEPYWGTTAVRKAVLLARYADLLKYWTVDERERVVSGTDDGIEPPGGYAGKWELQSDPLTVSERNAERIRQFRNHFESELAAIGDADLEREVELMETILAAER